MEVVDAVSPFPPRPTAIAPSCFLGKFPRRRLFASCQRVEALFRLGSILSLPPAGFQPLHPGAAFVKGRIAVCCLCLAIVGLCSASSAEAQSGFFRPANRVCASRPVLRAVGSVVRTTVRGTRRVAGFGTQVVTEIHPGIRIADAMGMVDRHRIVRIIRGF